MNLVVGETYLYGQPGWGGVVVFEEHIRPNGVRIRWVDGLGGSFCVRVESLRERPSRFDRSLEAWGDELVEAWKVRMRGAPIEDILLGEVYLLEGAPVRVMQCDSWSRVQVDKVMGKGDYSVSLVVDARDLVHPIRTRFARGVLEG